MTYRFSLTGQSAGMSPGQKRGGLGKGGGAEAEAGPGLPAVPGGRGRRGGWAGPWICRAPLAFRGSRCHGSVLTREQGIGKLRSVIPANGTDLPAVTYFGFCTVPSDKEKDSITLSTAERQILGCCFSPSSSWDLSFYPQQGSRTVPV